VQRHEVDAVSLTFGLLFLGIANAWLMVDAGAADVAGLRWFFPVLLLGAGAAGVVSSLLRGRRAREDALAEATPEATPLVDTPEGQS
jgi:hypothetical protein